MEETLAAQNPWWTDSKVSGEYEKSFQRKYTAMLLKELDDWKISSLIGPRRAGKTFILHHIIAHLLEQKIDAKRIVYLQFGKPKLNEKGIIEKLIDFISKNMGEAVTKKNPKVYIFLDEVHKLDTWAEELKDLVDMRLNIKIFVSASSSLSLIKGSGTGLAGRINHHIILPLDFKEYVRIKLGVDEEGPLDKLYYKLLGRSKEIALAFSEYLTKGGYPECAMQGDLKIIYKNLLDYKDLSFEKDIFELAEIRDAKTLNNVIFLLASLLSQRITYNKIGSIVNAKLDTVKKYISLFEDIFMVKEKIIFSHKPYFSLRQEKKITFIDCGMANAINEKFDFDEVYISNLVENAVSRMVLEKRLAFSISSPHYYWIDEKGNEVDIIDIENGKPLPIEIKYRENPDDTKSIMLFMSKFDCKNGIIITKNLFKKQTVNTPKGTKTLLFVPAWLFLLSA